MAKQKESELSAVMIRYIIKQNDFFKKKFLKYDHFQDVAWMYWISPIIFFSFWVHSIVYDTKFSFYLMWFCVCVSVCEK